MVIRHGCLPASDLLHGLIANLKMQVLLCRPPLKQDRIALLLPPCVKSADPFGLAVKDEVSVQAYMCSICASWLQHGLLELKQQVNRWSQ